MDWNSFWGSNMPAAGSDPYEPDAEQRRRILQDSLRSLGQGMLKSAFSPTWAGFGLGFNEGLAGMADTQKSGYQDQMKLNQQNALFKENMEQEKMTTEHNKLALKHETEDDQIAESIKKTYPAMVDSMDQAVTGMLGSAQVDPSQKRKLDVLAQQWKTQIGLAKTDPVKYAEKLNAIAEDIATITGQKEAFDEAGQRAVESHVKQAGWINEDGSPDIPGFVAWQEKQRNLTVRQKEAQIGATNRRNQPKPTDPNNPKGGPKPLFTAAQVGTEVGRITKITAGLRQVDGKFQDKAASQLKSLGLSPIADVDGGLSLSKEDMERFEYLQTDEGAEKEAEDRLTRRAQAGRATAGGPSVAAPATDIPKERQDQLTKLLGAQLPPKNVVSSKDEKQKAKFKAKLKAGGLTDVEIKFMYGI